MTNKRTISITLCLAMVMIWTGRTIGDDVNCVIVSAGAQMETTPNGLANAGQVAIGTATDGNVTIHAGGIHCIALGVITCLKGDVDQNGVIDGMDIDEYVQVLLTGVGTPKQLCAADISQEDFVQLLLNQ